MIKEITIATNRWEFGNSISCGLLYPYNLRINGWKTHVSSRMRLPKEWTDSWYDEFGETSSPHEGLVFTDKRLLESFLYGDIKLSEFKPICLPKIKRNISDRYVVFIPTIPEKAVGNYHKLGLCLSFEAWMNLADYIKNKGMKVISFTCHESCLKEMSEEIGDISFYAEKKDLKPNFIFKEQLEWMANAETSVSFGGALHIAYSFNIPGIGYDGQMVSNYKTITKSFDSFRKDFHLLQSQEKFANSIQMKDFKVNKDIANKFYMEYSNMIIEKLENVLGR